MKKYRIISAILLVTVFALILAACNAQGQSVSGNRIISGPDIQRFDYAYIMLGDKVIAEGKVEQWRDYKDSDTIQIMIDGNYYLTFYSNVVMVSSAKNSLNGYLVDYN